MDLGSQVIRLASICLYSFKTLLPGDWTLLLSLLLLSTLIHQYVNQALCFSDFILFILRNICQLTILHFPILKCPIFFGFHNPSLCCFFSYLINVFFLFLSLTPLLPPAHGNMDIHQGYAYISLHSLNDLIYFCTTNHYHIHESFHLIPFDFLDVFTWSLCNCSVQGSSHV